MANVGLKVSANDEQMTLSLERPSGTVASIIIPTEDAAQIAGNVLEAAKAAYDATGKPPPHEDDGVSLTVVHPSGYNVVPGRTTTSTMIHIHFGETTLGIEVQNEDAQTLGRRLMAAAAEGAEQ
jgi:hypothetical protein